MQYNVQVAYRVDDYFIRASTEHEVACLSLNDVFHSLPLLIGYEFDYVFDWTILKYQQSLKSKAQFKDSVSISMSFFFH